MKRSIETETGGRTNDAPQTVPCHACGGSMRFDPVAGDLLCSHCGARRAVPSPGPERSRDLDTTLARMADEAELEETSSLACPGCGAEILWTGPVVAMECPFCSTPVVSGSSVHRHIKPQALLPFSIDGKAAEHAAKNLVQSQFLVPRALRLKRQVPMRLTGLYLPYWSFDASFITTYQGTPTGGKGGGASGYARESGSFSTFFEDELVSGYTALPLNLDRQLAPWDLRGLVSYRSDYLSGFHAVAYTRDLRASHHTAVREMTAFIHDDALERAVRADLEQVTVSAVERRKLDYRLVLLPVWIGTYMFAGRPHQVLVNGQSGKAIGQTPDAPLRTALLVALILLAAGLLVSLLSIL